MLSASVQMHMIQMHAEYDTEPKRPREQSKRKLRNLAKSLSFPMQKGNIPQVRLASEQKFFHLVVLSEYQLTDSQRLHALDQYRLSHNDLSESEISHLCAWFWHASSPAPWT